jgi:hypothetical protein
VIFLVVLGLAGLVAIIAGITQGAGNAIAAIIIVPIALLLYTIFFRIFFRIYLEIVIVLFRIMETNQELVELARAQGPGGAPPTAPMSSPPPPPAPAA